MTDIFTHEFHIHNRTVLVEQSQAQLIVLSANGLLQRSADTTYPFRQDSNFWYLTGLNEPDFTLVIQEGDSFLIAPKRGDHRDMWDGIVSKATIKRGSGIHEIIEHHEGWMRLDKLLKKYKKVHTIAPAEPYLDHFGFFANPARGVLLQALRKHRNLEIVDIRKNIAQMRQIKQKPELEALQSAIDITIDSLLMIKKNITNYKTEYEIAGDITAHFIKQGASGHAYQPIIAAGANATTIHYVDNSAEVSDGLVLLDVGAEVQNYSADISRTFARGPCTKRQKQIHDSVRMVQQKALDILKPGLQMKQYEETMDLEMAKELKKLKLLDDISDKKQLKKFYPHLSSHFLGLDTHDAADYDLELAPGMVLTVEPGIYIPNEGIGIRIEDDVLITDLGNQNLSSRLPVTLS